MHVPVPAPPALVGRDRELAILRQHLDAAIAGRGGLVLIGGEAGVGKTALAEALCREATEQGAFVLVGRCYDLTETPAYGPWIDLFERYRPGDDLPSPPPAFAEPGIVGAVPSQAALFRQTEDFFAALCAQRPVVLLLEDLHWADPASLDLLRALARSLPALPFLLVATYRADELSPAHPLTRLLPAIVRESPVERLDLRPLRTQDLVTLVAERYRLTDADTTRLAAYAHQRSEGNPLFVGELLRTLEDEGIIQRTTAGWTLGFLANLRVPPLLRQIIDGRLARLGDERRRLLATAAVIGHEVPLNVWATIGEVDEDALLDVVERGVEARMLIESPDGARVQFAHALIRETLYEAILATRRRALHRRAGEALAALPRPDAHAVAHHFLQSGDARAAAWLIRAGENAQRAYAWQTAAARFEAAAARMADGGADAATR